MIKKISAKQRIGALTLASLLAAGFIAWAFFLGGSGVGPGEDVFVDPLWVFDRTDDKELAGASHNVFFGTVTSKIGQTNERRWLETQFKVDVLENLKGSLEGTVTVNQEGGEYSDGSAHRVRGDTMIEAGQTYLFATRHDVADDWHTIVPEYGNLKLEPSGDSSTNSNIMESEAAGTLRTRFTDAVANQKPFPYD